jgi:hypothetical protein
MSYDLGWCSTNFRGEKLKATAHVSANELAYSILTARRSGVGYCKECVTQ